MHVCDAPLIQLDCTVYLAVFNPSMPCTRRQEVVSMDTMPGPVPRVGGVEVAWGGGVDAAEVAAI